MNEMSPNGLVGVHCPVKAGKYCLQSFLVSRRHYYVNVVTAVSLVDCEFSTSLSLFCQVDVTLGC